MAADHDGKLIELAIVRLVAGTHTEFHTWNSTSPRIDDQVDLAILDLARGNGVSRKHLQCAALRMRTVLTGIRSLTMRMEMRQFTQLTNGFQRR